MIYTFKLIYGLISTVFSFPLAVLRECRGAIEEHRTGFYSAVYPYHRLPRVSVIAFAISSTFAVIMMYQLVNGTNRLASFLGFLSFWGIALFLGNKILKKRQVFDYRNLKKLSTFIRINQLYEEDIEVLEEFDSKGNIRVKKEKYVSNSLVLYYAENAQEITIMASKRGDKFNDVASQLGDKLSSFLSLVLFDEKDDLNYHTYLFKKQSVEREYISPERYEQFNPKAVIELYNGFSWDLAKTPHCLVAGQTGSGKTVMLNYLILETLRIRMEKGFGQVYICDCKNSDLAQYKYVLGDESVATTPNQVARIVREVKDIMEYRFSTYKNSLENYGKNFVDLGLPPVVLYIDELGALYAQIKSMKNSKELNNGVFSGLTELILKGREVGVNICLASQQVNANNLGGSTEMRDQFGVRIGLSNLKAENSKMLYGSFEGDLPQVEGKGVGYFYLEGLAWDKPKYFEAPFLDLKDVSVMDISKSLNNVLPNCPPRSG